MAACCTSTGGSACGKPGTASQFQRRELVAVPALRRAHHYRGLSSHVLEALVNELHRHGAFADGRGDALHRAGPHIPGREDAWPAGLQQKRLPPGGPIWGARQLRPGPDEPLLIPLDLRGEPTGSRVGTDKTESPLAFYGPFLPAPP